MKVNGGGGHEKDLAALLRAAWERVDGGGVPANFIEIYLNRTEEKWQRTLGGIRLYSKY